MDLGSLERIWTLDTGIDFYDVVAADRGVVDRRRPESHDLDRAPGWPSSSGRVAASNKGRGGAQPQLRSPSLLLAVWC